MRCSNCDAKIPEGGRFCVECGTPAPESALEVGQTAATGATERLPAPAGGPVCASCGTRNPPGAAFCVTCGRALAGRPVADRPASPIPPMPLPAPIAPAAPAPARPGNSAMWGGIGGGLFLIGLAALAITGWWWPGILILVGISSLVGSLASGQSIWAGLQGALWLFGIAALAITGWWWPGILILVGLSAILGAIVKPKL